MVRNFVGMMCAALLFVGVGFMSPQRDVGQLEKQLKIEDLTMYTMIHTRELREVLGESCSANEITDAMSLAQSGLARLDRKYAGMSDAEVLRHSWSFYEQLREKHEHVADKLGSDWYCTVKYMMYEVQQHLRDAHLAIFEETDIMKDFGGFDVSSIYGLETKKDYLDMFIDEREKYADLLDTRLKFSVKNKTFMDDLSSAEKALLTRAQRLMELNVYKVMVDLKKAGIFTSSDIEELKDVTMFEYVHTCGSVNGRYEVKETLTSQGEHIRYDTDALHLRVNLCGNFFMLRDIADVYEKIVAHELGHHVYYYKDRLGSDDFENICWTGGMNKKGNCSSNDFVSDYAQSQATEDYAEHFMHWFLDIVPGSTAILKKKSAHFDAL